MISFLRKGTIVIISVYAKQLTSELMVSEVATFYTNLRQIAYLMYKYVYIKYLII